LIQDQYQIKSECWNQVFKSSQKINIKYLSWVRRLILRLNLMINLIIYLNSSLILNILSSSIKFICTNLFTLMILMWDFQLDILCYLFMTQISYIIFENFLFFKLFVEFTLMLMLMLIKCLTFIIFKWVNHLYHWYHDILTDFKLLVRMTDFKKINNVFMK